MFNLEEVLPKLSNTDFLKLIDIHWRLSADLLSLPLTNLYNKVEKFSQEEKESLMKCAKEIVSQFKERQSLKDFIDKCKLFYNNSELIEIMRYADHNLKSEISYNDVMP
ncbi:hypothetical protein [Okeania sp. SIO1I7]|uniref:hypothetical protein n=1 Tax=Okeania sp. SIO1I7 TaxID=2607772 RepID=UPI0013F73F22|nr:hypothetical protein [Okeania sp. SIO1I7]NET24606.1 hypothetical protein [Okeania sp. SIO1I7]